MNKPFIPDERIKHSRGPWHFDAGRMNICTSEKYEWVEEDDEDPAYRTVIHTQSAMGGDDTEADKRLLIGSPLMFDLLNRIAGGEEGASIRKEAQELLEEIVG